MINRVSSQIDINALGLKPKNQVNQVDRPVSNEIEALHQIKNLSLDQRLRTHVEKLCKIPRYTLNYEGMQEAARYVKGAWKEIGFGERIEEQKFEVKNPNTGNLMLCKNIIVSLGPKEGERIVVGAHYDTDGLPDGREARDPASLEEVNGITFRKNPGADDNASAVAGLLETGRALKDFEQELYKKNVRIDLIAYANEECPYYNSPAMGSTVHAKSLKDKGAKVKAMLCYEMIGYFDDKQGSQGYLDKIFERRGQKLPWYLKPFQWLLKFLYQDTGNFITVVGNWASRKLAKQVKNGINDSSSIIAKSLAVPEKVLPSIRESDHWSYWKYDFPAIMITDTSYLRNPNYHKPTDTPDSLNYSKMAEVVNGTVGFIKNHC